MGCGYSLEPPQLKQLIEAVLTCTCNLCFEQIRKISSFFTENCQFLKLLNRCIMHRRVSVIRCFLRTRLLSMCTTKVRDPLIILGKCKKLTLS